MSNRLRNTSFTMDDIAEELGLSKSTVSRALSDSGRISTETKEKVRECARRHGFKPNLVAKALAGKQTLNLAVVIPFEANVTQMMFFHECLSGIVSRAAKAGYSVLVCMTKDDDRGILERVLEDGKIDAAILTQLRHDDQNLALLQSYKLPFVVIGSGAGDGVVCVDSRMQQNCAEFTKRCVAALPNGANVLFVCGPLDVEANNNRLSGFLSGMEETTAEQLHYAACTEPSDISDEISLTEWSLILCSDDVVCMQVLALLNEKRLVIGKDVALASFHDSVLLETHSPSISALRVESFGLGEAAAELSLEILDGKPCETVNYVDCAFMMRQSTF